MPELAQESGKGAKYVEWGWWCQPPSAENAKCCTSTFAAMAARLGLEPRQAESESAVLPLHHQAVVLLLKDHAACEPNLEPAMGFEPATACLQNRCSTVELRRQNDRSAVKDGWRKNGARFFGRA